MKWVNKLPIGLMHGVFFILMLLSVFLYKERLFADGAYYFFHLVNEGWFHIEADRITIALSQIFPLGAYYFGFPLKYLTVISSLGHELFFYGLFLLLLYKFKDKAAAICLLLIHLIGQLWLFYLPFNEISYGGALAIVFYALLRSNRWKDDKWLIIMLLVEWFVLFSHPENLYLIPVLLVLDYLNRGLIKSIHFPTLVVFLIGLLAKALNFSSYDQQKLGNSLEGSEVVESGENYTTEVFGVYQEFYPELILFFGSTIVFLLFKKQWNKLAYVITSVGILLLLINKIEATDTYYWYVEVVNTPVVFLVLLFFVFEVWERLPKVSKQLTTYLLLAICMCRVVWIWTYGEPLQQRTAQMERLVDYTQFLGDSKYKINSWNYEKEYSEITWANPIEALLFSAIDGKEKTVSIVTEEDFNYKENPRKLKDTSFLFRKFNVEPHEFLNPSFFQLKAELYHSLNNTGFTQEYKEMAKEISIKPISTKVMLLNSSDTFYLPVKISNRSQAFLPSSIDEQLFISYHWIKEGVEKVHQWDGMRTPLEVDVHGEYHQDIKLGTPAEKGTYFLQPDLVLEGRDWFGLVEKYKVIIH